MVARLTLDQFVRVQILVPQPKRHTIRCAFNNLFLIAEIKAKMALEAHETLGLIMPVYHVHR